LPLGSWGLSSKQFYASTLGHVLKNRQHESDAPGSEKHI